MQSKSIRIIDNHAHVGWFKDGYHSPMEIWTEERAAGVDEIVVSSTSTCVELYKWVIREMRSLKKLGGDEVRPILWLTPRMLRTYGLRKMLHSKIKWEGVKIHPELHPEWARNPILARKAIAVAQKLRVPMLIHTGEFPISEAKVFEYLFKEYPDQTFVLAHGRPLGQILSILAGNPNVFVDTAFMPIEDIKQIIEHYYLSQIIWGTDIPINRVYYQDIRTRDFISYSLAEIKANLRVEECNSIIARSVYGVGGRE